MLTVFVATHNGGRNLGRVLSAYSLLKPPDGGWKLVVIDNASDDDSWRITRSFADRLPLVCMAEPVRGKNRALNRALPELEGDLAVFADDDGVPDPDWLVHYRRVADAWPGYDGFGGSIVPLWDEEPREWILQWVRLEAVYSVTPDSTLDGPCDPTRVWGPNMALRAAIFRRGHRFDEAIGPDGSRTYAMGSETELMLRLAVTERIRCWHCSAARVRHIVKPESMRAGWILGRGVRLGRCIYREGRQKRAAGLNVPAYDPEAARARLIDAIADLAAARSSKDACRVFKARWQVNLMIGCLVEAARSDAAQLTSRHDAYLQH